MTAFPLLRAEQLSIVFGPTVIVGDVSLDVRPGEMVGLVGPNGAGKSTLLKALSGLLPPARGRLFVAGRPGHRMRPREMARIAAYVPQDTALPFDFEAMDVVLMGRHPHRGRFEQLSSADHVLAARVLEIVGVAHLARRAVTTLSGGERQLVHLARALAQEPSVLLLDEPIAALDLHHQLHVLGLLRDQVEGGRAVVAVLHDLTQAARFCDRVVLLHHGSVVAADEPRHVLQEQRIADVYRIAATIREDEDTRSQRVTPLHVLPVVPACDRLPAVTVPTT